MYNEWREIRLKIQKKLINHKTKHYRMYTPVHEQIGWMYTQLVCLREKRSVRLFVRVCVQVCLFV